MERISINYDGKYIRVWEGGRGAKQTYFTIIEYRSLTNAYQAAVEYESDLSPEKRIGRKKPHTYVNVNNTSGVVGVCPFLDKNGDLSGWRANWVEYVNGKRRQRTENFSFFNYGKSAFYKAVKCRKTAVGQIYKYLS